MELTASDLISWATVLTCTACFVAFIFRRNYSGNWKVRTPLKFSRARRRELSASEIFYHNTYLKADSLVTFVSVLDSNSSLPEVDILGALDVLARRHPMLRMKIEEVQVDGESKFYFREIESFVIDFRTCCDLNATDVSDWQEILTRDLLIPIDAIKGPLWRVTRLKEVANAENTMFTNCFSFTFHHSLIDGYSFTLLVDQFVEFLGKDKAMKEIVDQKNSCNELLPACETLIADSLKMNWLQRVSQEIFTRLRVSQIIPDTDDLLSAFFNKFPVKNESLSSKKETCATFINFSQEQTATLLASCRQRGCTLNGVLTAAASMAMAELLNDGNVSEDCVIDTSFMANMRKYSEFVNTGSDIGLYVTVIPCKCYIPVYSSSNISQKLWEIAKKYTNDSHKMVASNECLTSFLKIQNLSNHSLICAHFDMEASDRFSGRYKNEYFSISNMGRFDQSSKENSSIRINKLYFAYGEHIRGPLFVNNFVTVDGQLCWTAIYFPNVTDATVAEMYKSRILSKIQLAMERM